jgi:two-component system LytT family response regulator
MKTLRVIVADDERIARQRIVRLLSEMEGVVVCAECSSGDEALTLARRESIGNRIDVAVLDVEMPGMTGMDAAALLTPHVGLVVFCTAHASYAAQAFDRGAIDYVLKPVDAARLKIAIDRARSRRDRETSSKLPVATTTGVSLVDPASITHAVLDGALVTIFTDTGEELLASDSLADLAERLPHMIRVHRRALVALDHVTRLESVSSGGYVAHTKRGGQVEVSRQAARELRRRLGLRGGREDHE